MKTLFFNEPSKGQSIDNVVDRKPTSPPPPRRCDSLIISICNIDLAGETRKRIGR
jgi:hypothetical protein